MKCIKIDVVTSEVYEIEIEGGLHSMYDALGLGCEMIEKVKSLLELNLDILKEVKDIK